MARSRASAKKAGTDFEVKIVTTLQETVAPHARRKPKTGAKDEADVSPGDGWPFVIESKNVLVQAFPQWVREADVEAENAGVPYGVVWSKVKGKGSPLDGIVAMSGRTFIRLLEQFAP